MDYIENKHHYFFQRFYNSLSGSNSVPTSATRTYGVQARSSEQVKSSYYFVRVKNGEYNYSNNPSFVTGSLGELKFTTFIENPTSYITTVGLYNDNRELLAVAKLSQPITKDFTKEALIKYVNLKRSKLELERNLEQMRAFENNMKIHVGFVNSIPLSVDTEEDLQEIKKNMENK